VNGTNTDKASHGGLDFVPWFLQSVQQHDALSGRRTLNELDVHWFPQGINVSGGATDSMTDALRLRESRNLWDMTYSDESWVATQTYLIPRLQAWVDQYYPGTKLGISEWNYGADNDINGALAIANVLGIYGWQGLYSANYWKHPATGSPGQLAFEMYRNYDGAGSSFGDVSIQAASNTPGTVLSFGSVRSSTGQVILMLINEEPSNTESASIALNNVPLSSPVQVYQYSAADLTAIVHLPNIAATNPLAVSLPPHSITELVMGGGRKGGHGTPTPVSGTLTPTPTPVASRRSRVTPTPTGGGPT
jgi:Glycoside hydrolase family 44